MTDDPTEPYRRAVQSLVNQLPAEEIDGPQWTTAELGQEFTVHSFAAPFVIVTRKATGERGTLLFKHLPRIYFAWCPDVE